MSLQESNKTKQKDGKRKKEGQKGVRYRENNIIGNSKSIPISN